MQEMRLKMLKNDKKLFRTWINIILKEKEINNG